MIGIGLNDEKDISVRGLETVRQCDKVFLEGYTSILGVSKSQLEKFYGKEIIFSSRDDVESDDNEILFEAKDSDVAFLVIGDVFSATTHTDLRIRAKNLGIKVEIIYNASVLTAVGVTGLELYKFGKTTSIVFPDDNWLPETPYDVIKMNKANGLHTLCLLDIKTAEKSKEDIMSGRGKAQEARFMTVNEGLSVLQKLEDKRKEGIISDDMLVVGCARLGSDDYEVFAGKLSEVLSHDFGEPLHCLIIPGKLHFVEEEALGLN
jgi:diphthine synthase